MHCHQVDILVSSTDAATVTACRSRRHLIVSGRGGKAPPYLTKMPALSSMNSKRACLMSAAATSRQFCSLSIPFPLKTHQPDFGALSCIAGLSSKCLVEWSLQKTPHVLHPPTCAMHVEYSVQNDTQKCHSKPACFHRLQRRRERNCGGCSIN